MSRARLLIERGDTLSRQIDWDDSDGDPIDLTGYTITCSIVVGEISFALTEGSGLTVDDNDGQITLTLSRAQTATFEEQFGTWRLYALSGGGVGTTLAEGLVFVSF